MLASSHWGSGKRLLALSLVIGALRLISLGLYPLTDTTEARYAEIARIMVETGNWITPQVDYGVPFWGKPPLSSWLSALSFKLFGINEVAARLPALLLGIAVVLLVYFWVRRLKGRECAAAAAVILPTTVVFFVNSGAVMTDPALLFGTTLSMVSFYRAQDWKGSSINGWGYLFFVGLAIGLLAKGPIGPVLTLLPIGLWVLLTGNWRTVFHCLPWVSGILLTAVLSLPWFLLAEWRTPGFLDYFIIGEHWKRFTDPGWQGDLYGRAHDRTRGTIWLYWLAATMPWSLVLAGNFMRRRRRAATVDRFKSDRGLSLYLLSWAIAPMLFFTLAGNILWTYVLPGIPAFAILAAMLLMWQSGSDAANEISSGYKTTPVPTVAAMMCLCVVLLLTAMPFGAASRLKCQKNLVEAYQARKTAGEQLVYLGKRPLSAQFYSAGKARKLELDSDAKTFLDDGKRDFFAIKKSHFDRVSEVLRRNVEPLAEFNGYFLVREKLPATKSEITRAERSEQVAGIQKGATGG